MNVRKWILTSCFIVQFTKYFFCLKYTPKLHVIITILMKLKFIFIKAVINYREKRGERRGKRKNKEKSNEFPWHVLFFRTYP